MTRTGTPYFISITAARQYYRPYHYEDTAAAVTRKLATGEIHIGPPPLKPGQTAAPDQEGRYIITDQEPTP